MFYRLSLLTGNEGEGRGGGVPPDLWSLVLSGGRGISGLWSFPGVYPLSLVLLKVLSQVLPGGRVTLASSAYYTVTQEDFVVFYLFSYLPYILFL